MLNGDLDRLVDHARLARHETLMGIWRELPVEELLIDMSVLAQFAAFRCRQEGLQVARVLHAQGATHDCAEWREAHDGLCPVCGQ
jgi:hypothetical protein